MSRDLPSVDLVVATVGRTDELGRFLDSIEAQGYGPLRVIVVDQNGDERVAEIAHGRGFELVHERAERGLSRARNAGLGQIESDLVAFPDDDCVYPPGLLERVAERFGDSGLDGLTGRAVDSEGRSSASWKSDPALLTDDNLWNRAISFTIFLRAGIVRRYGMFDEQLGLGSGTAWSSGEETEYLVRAVAGGARIDYDPALTVTHDEKPGGDGAKEGASLGYILRKHDYPARAVTRMLIRPAGGALVALARRDLAQARFQLDTLRGRLRGYRS